MQSPYPILPHLEDYRQSSMRLWERYGLFTLNGTAARHGGGKKDLSMLMLYASADSYLNEGGKLGFVITQTLFQTKGAGDGFRRFRIGKSGAFLKVVRVDDMVQFQPFEGAANWTSTIIVKKGEETVYPVQYFNWFLLRKLPDSGTEDWKKNFRIEPYFAQPIDENKSRSPWLVTPTALKVNIHSLVGPSDYHGHLGANSGGANGVYWVKIINTMSDGILIQNIAQKSKKKVHSVERTIEPELLLFFFSKFLKMIRIPFNRIIIFY